VNLRIAKREGVPVTLVPEGSADSSVVGVKRVSELDYYNLRFGKIATKLGITTSQTSAMIKLLKIKEDEEMAKMFFSTWCYSQKALSRLEAALSEKSAQEWWQEHRATA
jgi:hypothetical protein